MRIEKKVLFIRVCTVFLIVSLMALLGACGTKDKTKNAEILSQKTKKAGICKKDSDYFHFYLYFVFQLSHFPF